MKTKLFNAKTKRKNVEIILVPIFFLGLFPKRSILSLFWIFLYREHASMITRMLLSRSFSILLILRMKPAEYKIWHIIWVLLHAAVMVISLFWNLCSLAIDSTDHWYTNVFPFMNFWKHSKLWHFWLST